MANYRETDKGQGLFLTINLEDQILPGAFEWTMSQFMDTRVNYSGFDQSYNNDETRASAIHPRIMLKIVLYGYSQGLQRMPVKGEVHKIEEGEKTGLYIFC
jgi:hypothetical protein